MYSLLLERCSAQHVSLIVVASGRVYTSPRDRRRMRGEIAYLTLEVRHRARHVEREFLLVVFECECSPAWVLASKLSSVMPRTRRSRLGSA